MANVKITVNGPLMDGHKVTFKAPCNCDVVEKLDVRYVEDGTQKSKLFTMKDTHGNELTGLGNLFFEGAYVNVVLDTNSGFAYLQNADTNGYIEKRLGGYTFYNNPSVVGLVSDSTTYRDENDKLVLANSVTGAALLADAETYVALTVEGNYYSVGGADTVDPFKSGGNKIVIPVWSANNGDAGTSFDVGDYNLLTIGRITNFSGTLKIMGYKTMAAPTGTSLLAFGEGNSNSVKQFNISNYQKIEFTVTRTVASGSTTLLGIEFS